MPVQVKESGAQSLTSALFLPARTPRFPSSSAGLRASAQSASPWAARLARGIARRVRIEVNGQPREVAAGVTVAALLSELGIGGGPVAVERNRVIVPRAQHAATALLDGDKLEVVQFVGGG